jgi:hypothetical protein
MKDNSRKIKSRGKQKRDGLVSKKECFQLKTSVRVGYYNQHRYMSDFYDDI